MFMRRDIYLVGCLAYLILEGCSGYLSHVRDLIAETSFVESVPIVCEFPNVFSADLPRFLLAR